MFVRELNEDSILNGIVKVVDNMSSFWEKVVAYLNGVEVDELSGYLLVFQETS